MKKCYGKQMLALLLAFVVSLTSAGVSPLHAEAAKSVKAKSVSLNHSEYTLKKGKSLKLKATVAPKKAKNKKIVWKSSKPSVVTVNAKGVVKAKKKGSANVTATVKGTKIKAACKVSVGTPVQKITVKSKNISLEEGKTYSIKVTVAPKSATNKGVTYKSSNTKAASVSAKGKVTAKKAGTAKVTVTAKDGSGKKAVVTVKVTAKKKPAAAVTSVKVTVAKSAIQKGETVQATAQVLPATAPNKSVTWSSSNTAVATVDRTGKITGTGIGTAAISAKSANGKSGSVNIRVNPVAVESVTVSPEEDTLRIDDTLQLKVTVFPENADNQKVRYESSDTGVAVVSDTGLVTAVRNGQAVIKVISEDGEKQAESRITVGIPTTDLTLSETQKKIAAGRKFTLEASVEPQDATNQKVNWSSSNEEVAVVSDGVVTAKKDGQAVIMAKVSGTSLTASCELTVETLPKQIYLNKTSEAVAIGQELMLKASILPENAGNQKVTWSTSDAGVATVQDGKVTAVAVGKTTITARTEAGNQAASCEVTVGNVRNAANFQELKTALAAADGGKIILNTTENGNYEIPQAEYAKVALSVNAPNATITNYASFGKIEIQAISKDTWIEKATGNTIDLVAKEAHVQVDGEDVVIQAGAEAEQIKIDNNGTVGGLVLSGASSVNISGTNRTSIPVTARAEGTVISTSIPVSVDAAANVTLKLRAGAENSSVQIADETVTPVIQGIGTIPVTNLETGETVDVVADNLPPEQGGEEEKQKGFVTGMVAGESQTGIAGAVLYLIPYQAAIDKDNLEAAIEAAENQDRCYVTTTKADGKYTTPEVPYGNYVLIVKADGLQTYFQTLILNRDSVANEVITLVPPTQERGSVKGTLYDAFDASRVPAGITLYLRKGAGQVTGEPVAVTQTNADGGYLFENITAGTYTIQVVDTRAGVEVHYVRMSFNVSVLANTTIQENMTITKAVDSSQIRFVLTWGKEAEEVPSDLDSHLVGPGAAPGSKFHTYFSNDSYTENGIHYADLDVDDIDWEGPETTTVYQPVDGLYHFYVYDYTDQEDRYNTRLATSQATVEVYIGDRSIAVYHVPDAVGTLWDVCTYDIKTNTLTPVNNVYYHPGNSETVGMDPIDIARNKLASVIERWRDCDFGERLAAEISGKLSDAERILAEETDYEQVSQTAEELDSYFRRLSQSTEIEAVSSPNLRKWYVYRQGSEDDPGASSGMLKGYSVIDLHGYSEDVFRDLQISLSDENAVGEMRDSDKEGYHKLYVVTNSVTKASEKYYLNYREYVADLEPVSIKDEGNYIFGFDTGYEEYDEGVIYYLNIRGENETLANPVFEFEDAGISGVYELSTEEGIVGKLKVSYKGSSREYLVRYTQHDREIALQSIAEPGNVFRDPEDLNYDEIEVGDEYYNCYYISGYRQTLGVNGLNTVMLAFNVMPERYVITAEAGASWTHKVTVTYKGREQVLYLKYTQDAGINLLPREGMYLVSDEEDEWEEDFRHIDLVEQDGSEWIRLTGYSKEFTAWDSVSLFGDFDDITYQVVTRGDAHEVLILLDGEEIERYPIYYEWDIFRAVRGLAITDAGNYIVDWDVDYAYDEYGRYDILDVYGENPQPGNLTVAAGDADVSVVYTPVADSERGIGRLTVTYLTQSKEYWVNYSQQIRTLYFDSVDAVGQMFSSPEYDWYEDEDDSYRIYSFTGTKDVLDGSETFKFTAYNDDDEKEDVVLDSVSLEAVEGKAWNYLLKAVYKGKVQSFYLNYRQMSDAQMLPTEGSYTYGSYTEDLRDISLYTDASGNESVRILGDCQEEECSNWNAISFTARGSLEYRTTASGAKWYLQILLDGKEVKRYPLFYETYKNLDISISPEKSGIIDHQVIDQDDGGKSLYLYGENGMPSSLVVSTDDEVEQAYEALAGEEGRVGRLTLSYKTQKKVYDVFYMQVQEIEAEQPVSTTFRANYQYYGFTPATDGTYYFYSQGAVDIYGWIRDAYGSELAWDDDSGEDMNFYFSFACKAGVTYYVGVRAYSYGGEQESTLYVSASAPSSARAAAQALDTAQQLLEPVKESERAQRPYVSQPADADSQPTSQAMEQPGGLPEEKPSKEEKMVEEASSEPGKLSEEDSPEPKNPSEGESPESVEQSEEELPEPGKLEDKE